MKTKLESDSPLRAATCSASSGPRLRCRDQWANGYYGTYKGHRVAVERDHKTEPWAFLVTAPSGLNVADGYTKEPMTLREAIIHALTGAGLWQNA